MDTPSWALTLVYWAHMLATVIWIGGLTVLTLFVIPAGRRTLDDRAYADLLTGTQPRLDSLSWFSVVVLLGSGLLQMSANPNYDGLLTITSLWAGAILVKHVFFLCMVALSAYLSWGLMPALRRAAIRQARGDKNAGMEKLHHRQVLLLQVNLFFGVLVLGLTALARAS